MNSNTATLLQVLNTTQPPCTCDIITLLVSLNDEATHVPVMSQWLLSSLSAVRSIDTLFCSLEEDELTGC